MIKKKTEKSSSNSIEKRIYPRKTLRSQLIFEDESGEGFIYFYSTDISVGGIFLESDIPLKLGTHVLLSFALRDGEAPIRGTGTVVRLERNTEDSQPVVGMGLQFAELPEDAKKKIQEFIAA